MAQKCGPWWAAVNHEPTVTIPPFDPASRFGPCVGVLAAVIAALSVPAVAQVTTDGGTIDPARIEQFFAKPGYSPYAGTNFPARPFWGEQHLHTSLSPDAIASGTRVDPDSALNYAKGAEITSSTGVPVKLSRPYDWMAVTDHSDALGVMASVLEGDPALMADPTL